MKIGIIICDRDRSRAAKGKKRVFPFISRCQDFSCYGGQPCKPSSPGGPVSRLTCGVLLALAFGLAAAACDDDGGTGVDLTFERTFPTSLHATGSGMQYWYEQPDGFGAYTGVPFSVLSCGGCHANNPSFQAEPGNPCSACHRSADGRPLTPARGTVPQSACLQCHSRQAAEIALDLPDVHRRWGFQCKDCHSGHEVHGDGSTYRSMFDKQGRDEVECRTCHTTIAASRSHDIHARTVACQSCHMRTSVTCVNCHFEAEVSDNRKMAYGRVTGWQFLGNWNGKVHPFNFQSVKYGELTFVAYAPFTGHTITQKGVGCAACHQSAALAEYLATGRIDVVRWDAGSQRLVPITGVVPIPPDWATSIRHDFVTFVGADRSNQAAWQFLGNGPDYAQMLYGEPLTRAQLDRLGGVAGD
jgi:hypothetical protein